jgi:hypothetical protein
MDTKYINLNADDRFVNADTLRRAYLRYEASLNPAAAPFVEVEHNHDRLELGIVDSADPILAKAISSILTRSLEDGKNSNGGYLPAAAVERVQTEIISPHGIASLWGVTGHRFVLSRAVRYAVQPVREIIASILVARSKDTIFFLTGRYNNLRHSMLEADVDLDQPNDLANPVPGQKWFDRFAFPELGDYKPVGFHQIANFVVDKASRGESLGKFLIESIVQHYSLVYLAQSQSTNIEGVRPLHSQHLLCGRGFWQVGDPPWKSRMTKIGFYLRGGAESFFIEQPWAPLPPISYDKGAGPVISNENYNATFGLLRRPGELHAGLYDPPKFPKGSREHLWERIDEVKRLARDQRAKLQYFQMMYNFV